MCYSFLIVMIEEYLWFVDRHFSDIMPNIMSLGYLTGRIPTCNLFVIFFGCL